jgi:hypothetical protein
LNVQTFDAPVSSAGQALDWLAQLVSHIPNKGESAGGGVRYYGFYSNASFLAQPPAICVNSLKKHGEQCSLDYGNL